MSNRNTAQTTGNKLNPLSTIKNLWDRYKSGKDKKQRQKNFESKLQFQKDKMEWDKKKFGLSLGQKIAKDNTKNKLDRDKLDHKKKVDKDAMDFRNDKLKWDQEKTKNLYDQKERHHQQKMDIDTANAQIKHNNSKVFQNDVQGKQALRNASITATERALKKDGYKGTLTRAEEPTKKPGPDPINNTLDKVKTNNKPVAWKPGDVSGVNVKGSKGNRKKGLQ